MLPVSVHLGRSRKPIHKGDKRREDMYNGRETVNQGTSLGSLMREQKKRPREKKKELRKIKKRRSIGLRMEIPGSESVEEMMSLQTRSGTQFPWLLISLPSVTGVVEGTQQFEKEPSYTEVNPQGEATLYCRIFNLMGQCSWQKDGLVSTIFFPPICRVKYQTQIHWGEQIPHQPRISSLSRSKCLNYMPK